MLTITTQDHKIFDFLSHLSSKHAIQYIYTDPKCPFVKIFTFLWKWITHASCLCTGWTRQKMVNLDPDMSCNASIESFIALLILLQSSSPSPLQHYTHQWSLNIPQVLWMCADVIYGHITIKCQNILISGYAHFSMSQLDVLVLASKA